MHHPRFCRSPQKSSPIPGSPRGLRRDPRASTSTSPAMLPGDDRFPLLLIASPFPEFPQAKKPRLPRNLHPQFCCYDTTRLPSIKKPYFLWYEEKEETSIKKSKHGLLHAREVRAVNFPRKCCT